MGGGGGEKDRKPQEKGVDRKEYHYEEEKIGKEK